MLGAATCAVLHRPHEHSVHTDHDAACRGRDRLWAGSLGPHSAVSLCKHMHAASGPPERRVPPTPQPLFTPMTGCGPARRWWRPSSHTRPGVMPGPPFSTSTATARRHGWTVSRTLLPLELILGWSWSPAGALDLCQLVRPHKLLPPTRRQAGSLPPASCHAPVHTDVALPVNDTKPHKPYAPPPCCRGAGIRSQDPGSARGWQGSACLCSSRP